MLDSSVGPDLLCFCCGFMGHCWILSWARPCLFFFLDLGCIVGFFCWPDSFIGNPQSTKQAYVSGKSNSVEWDCGDGFGDLCVGFFSGQTLSVRDIWI